MGEDNVQTIATRNPSDSAVNQLVEAERKKKQDELKKAVEEAMKAKEALTNAVQKVMDLEDEIKGLGDNKLDLKGLADALGIR